ncbi:MAG TPA: ATP-binding protein [Gemmatimonadales bacterium]|nr:ATP-binding protein [Gemmatimonadales bacterium]
MDARTLLDGLDVGLVAIAPDWTIDEWTAPAARLTGLPASRVLGQNFWVAFPTARGTHVERVLQDVLADGQERQYLWPARAPELSGLVFETRVTRGPRNYLLLLFRQVREEIPAQSRAAQILTAFETERRLYYQLFSALPTPTLILALDGQVLEANPAAVTLLGLPDAPAARGRCLSDWVAPSQREPLTRTLREAVARRRRARFTFETPGEPPREVDAVVDNVDPHSAGGRLLFLAEDVSTELLLQRKLFQADRLAQLGALLAGVAHELNNPLAAIAAFAEVLETDAASDEARESAAIIHSEALRAGRVIQTLLDYARQRPQLSTAVDVRDVVDRALALIGNQLRRARVQPLVAIPDEVPAVLGDPQELQQVILNGVVNAIQAIESTGRAGRILVSARRADGFVVLTVEDTGPGVPSEILDRVFDPFFTTKGEQGTGLGLSISLGLVRGMGGRMWLENVEGGGARLLVELPVEGARPTPGREGAEGTATRPLAVLLVEDEPAVRRGMAKMMERLGHRVTAAEGYTDARARLQNPAPAYDALVVDVHLDQGRTGFDLFEDLRLEGRGRERRVVFITGDSVSVRTREALARTERPVLKKPFRLGELREVLDRVAGPTAPPPLRG